MWKRRFALAALIVSADAAAAARLTYSDGICEYRVAYDAKKIDGARLKATFDYLQGAAAPLEPVPAMATAEDISKIDVAAYRARCAARRAKLEAVRLVDVAGLDALRRQEIDTLDRSCTLGEATLAAAKGDIGPMRAAAPACGRWADLLALPEKDLKARFNDLARDLCETSTDVNLCAGQMQRDGEGPGSEARRRLAVSNRWGECARKPEDIAADTPADREKRRLAAVLAKWFKAKTLSCAQ